MDTAATYADKARPHLWDGRGTLTTRYDHLAELKHPDLPLVLMFRTASRYRRDYIEVTASLPQTVGGNYYTRKLTGYNDPPLSRKITESRFQTSLTRVASEIITHVATPAAPLCLKAIKAVADRHALEYKSTSFAHRLARRHDLHISEQGDTLYLCSASKAFDQESYGNVRIDKSGYCEVLFRNLSPDKLERLMEFLNQ